MGTRLDTFLVALRTGNCHPQANGEGYWASCPVCDPRARESSLYVTDGKDGRVDVVCKGKGCDRADILAALDTKDPDAKPISRPAPAPTSAPSPTGNRNDQHQQTFTEKEAEKRLAGYKPKTFNSVAGTLGELRHLWPDWLVIGNLSMIYSKPKHGKTRVYLRLIKTLWSGETWPDGTANEWPAGTKTLVIPYDRNHLEIAADMKALGIPDEAAVCPYEPSDPLGISLLDICDPLMLAILDKILTDDRAIKFLVVDTLTYGSNKSLSKPEDMKAILDQLIRLAAKHGVAALALMHENKEGEALGRRISERARVLIRLERYAENDPTRLRLFVKDSNFKGRPALTVTHTDKGVEFGPDKGSVGNGADRCYACAKFLVDYLWEKGVKVEVEFGTVIDALGHAGFAGTLNEENRWSDRKLFGRAVAALNAKVEPLHDLARFRIERREGTKVGRAKPVILYWLEIEQEQPNGKPR
jgi:hypothetical protein